MKLPSNPNLKALADKYSMQYETIGPHDIVSLNDEPIAQSAELTNEIGRPGPPFTAMMFGVSNNQAYIPKAAVVFPTAYRRYVDRQDVCFVEDEGDGGLLVRPWKKRATR